MRTITTAAAALALVFACATSAFSATPTQKRQAIQQLKGEARSASGARVSTPLLALQKASAKRQRAGERDLQRKLPALRARNGYVSVNAVGDNAAALRTQLVSKGMVNAKVYEHSVSGRVPVSALRDVAATAGLKVLRPTMATTRRGLTTTQGDRSQRSDVARRQFGVDGRGVKIGVLSDSFDCAIGPFDEGQNFTRAADDVRNGDLPAGIKVLKDLSDEPSEDCIDEGRAMMQIIHDVAPGAKQSFYTAFESQADFAAGIIALADDGAQIIVDDIIYFAETMFEHDNVADAVEKVARRGVAYFSAAGNDARQGYQSAFRNSGRPGALDGAVRHDFDPARRQIDDLQKITADDETVTVLALNWDEPSVSANGVRGSRSDLDLIFYDAAGVPVELCSDDPEQLVCQFAGIDYNIDGDAVELAQIVNFSGGPLVFQVGIELYEGPAPNFLQYVWFDLDFGVISVDEFDTQSGTVYGHANTPNGEAVGAAAWYQTQEWGSPLRPTCIPACLNNFSSAGGVPILFGSRGQRLHFPLILLKPGITAPDGGNTSFFLFNLGFDVPGSSEDDEFPNFFGTSAAAPHAAAVAALMLDKRQRDIAAGKRFFGPRKLSPQLIYAAMRLTADDMRLRNFGGEIGPQPVPGAAGFDLDTGFGMLDASRAVRAVAGH
jgi:subtilisin family serine protease